MSASFNIATVALSFLSRGQKVLGWSLVKFSLKGAARNEKFGRNHLKTLHRPEKEGSSVCVVGFSNFSTAFVVRSSSSRVWTG